MLNFQQIIHRLTQFWEARGCMIHQGHDVEVGAGTFNPATFLRCLGPEPYQTAYVEPSRRPKDGRYGENPNRMQLFHQFQVILKPSPVDVQQTYLKSLEALGLDLKLHDIRFVHDDWESPTLGASGMGWEVWCDGMEISQFTYFQMVGSLPLKPITVEITYGLERLAMFIQNKESLYEVKWNDTLSFRDVALSSEIEWSTYNFEQSCAPMWLRHFDDYEREAKGLILKQLPIPAYDFVLKASHAFNMLDARGVISVTERTGYIGRIRDLARLVAVEYLKSREKLGYPLCKRTKKSVNKALPPVHSLPKFNPEKQQDFLLEIGSEQLPATFIPIGCAYLEKVAQKRLQELELSYEKIEIFGTPQRLAILISGLVEGTKTKETLRRGPPVTSAFDSSLQLTPQGHGFLKAVGIPPTSLDLIQKGKIPSLKIESIKGIEYLFATVKEEGRSTFQLLSEEIPAWILNIDFPKKMRWKDLEISYARPIHWILALYGNRIVPCQVGETVSNRFSFGHAQLDFKQVKISHPKDYLKTLKNHRVLADIELRKESILKQLGALEKKIKGKALEREKVLSQVLYLTEWPQLTSATFDPSYLKAPKEILISEMVEHQKYFPVGDQEGNLKNSFIITADQVPNALIRKGNQKVLSARLSDGVFLYEQDLKTPLEQFNERLKEMTHHHEMGTMFDKVKRVQQIGKVLSQSLEISNENAVTRACFLCKADLASALVGEFPDLQGTIGKYYALAQGESEEVAKAIEEHWMPKGERASLPQTETGVIVSLADKFDNLISCYRLGLKPSSSSDPYALRRQTIGIVNILIERKKSVHLGNILHQLCSLFPNIKTPNEVVQEILTFFTARAKSLFEEQGFKKDEIEASLQGLCIDPYDQFCKIQALHTFRKAGPQFSCLLEVYKRAKGQLELLTQVPFDPQLAQEPAEKELIKGLEVVQHNWKRTLLERDYLRAFEMICELQPPLAHLFETVKILADDPLVRANRIALLQAVFLPFQELLDFGKIQDL